MSQNTAFRRAADRMRQSAFVLPMFLVFLALMAISLVIGYEDYYTSYWGYTSLPTQFGFSWTAVAVALLPQVGQAGAAYIAIALADNEDDRLYVIMAFVIWVLLFGIDIYTDTFYRTDYSWQVSNEIMLTAIFQSIGIFTIGSELAFVVGFGMVGELLPDAIAELFSLIQRVKLAWHERMAMATERVRENRPRPR
jgi:hypothetical protein